MNIYVPALRDGGTTATGGVINRLGGYLHNGCEVKLKQQYLNYPVATFDGLATSINCNTQCLPATGDFIMEMMVYPDGANTSQKGYVWSQSTSQLRVYQSGSNLLIYFLRNGSTILNITLTDVPFNTWYKIKITRVGAEHELFVNDVSYDTYSSLGSFNAGNSLIGKYSTSEFSGRIRNFTIGDSYYKLDEGSGTVAIDSNGISDGTITFGAGGEEEFWANYYNDTESNELNQYTFWSADGESFDAKTIEELEDHVNFTENIYVVTKPVNGFNHINDALTYELDKNFTLDEYDLLNSSGSTNPSYAPFQDLNDEWVYDVNDLLVLAPPSGI